MSPAFHTLPNTIWKDRSNSPASLERIVNQLDLSPDRNRTHLAGNTGDADHQFHHNKVARLMKILAEQVANQRAAGILQ